MNEVPWIWLAVRASGLTAWILLTLVVTYGLVLKTRLISKGPALAAWHRWLAVLSLGVLALHIGLLLIDPAVTFNLAQILLPFAAPWKPLAVGLGQLAILAVALVLVVDLSRSQIARRLGGKGAANAFKRSHQVAYAAWPLATAHYVLAGTDTFAPFSLALLTATAATAAFLLLARGHVPPPERAARPAKSEPPVLVPGSRH